ncbi:hypothetical protein BC751_3556 [Cecembia calidifontis]|uniref:Uncharacterized protein n=2 Tax=Cecembia TaxID=1187078 RepID=A0A4Q7PDT2_9BACT|nr:hypothetical protein CLV48_101735 [Cecembia rubra]RZS97928.1 hypothetical protein BC751_3556 [Cecembia calidifontis]
MNWFVTECLRLTTGLYSKETGGLLKLEREGDLQLYHNPHSLMIFNLSNFLACMDRLKNQNETLLNK